MNGLANFILRVLISGAAISLTAAFLPGMHIQHNDLTTFLILGLVIGLVNGILRPILIVLTLPITLVSLGLFVLVINAFLLLLVARIVPNLQIDGFWPALLGALIMGIISGLLESVLKPFESRHNGHGHVHVHTNTPNGQQMP
jgi:putative membrane protein